MSTKRKSQEIAATIAALKKDYQKAARSEFEAGLTDLFARHLGLKSISWSATDEYNDEGGSDFISTHGEPRINGVDAYDDATAEADEGENVYGAAERGDSAAKRAVKEVEQFLSDFPDSFYEDQFDRSSVFVTAKGISVE